MVHGEHAIHCKQGKQAGAVSVKRGTERDDGAHRVLSGKQDTDTDHRTQGAADRGNDVLYGVGFLACGDEQEYELRDRGAQVGQC